MTQATKKRRPHRPSLGRIARALPEVGSQEARALSHVLQCELCTDAALSILEIGNRRSRRKAPDYDAAMEAATARATWIFELTLRGMALAEELFAIADPEARRRRALELARVEPSSVAGSLLEAAKRLLETDPRRAVALAELAAAVVAEMNPRNHPSDEAKKLFAEAHLVMGESLYRLHERAEEAMDQAEKEFAEVSGIEPYPFSIRSLRRRRNAPWGMPSTRKEGKTR